jgi:hypothetical protein
MLKKNQPVKFCKPVSTMKSVYEAIEQGIETRTDIVESTGLVLGKVRAALFNLTFIGVIQRYEDKEGRSRYTIPGRMVGDVAHCLKGVRSIFDVR